MHDSNSRNGINLVWVGLLVEGGVMALGLLLAWFGLYDHGQPISSIQWPAWNYAVRWGLIMVIPMLVYLTLFHFWTPDFYRPMQQVIDLQLRPMFAHSSYLELLVLSMMAGFGEELFFRWCLQGGITSLLKPIAGAPIAIGTGILVASLVFGLCHWVNRTYAITTAIVGAYLGATMVWTESWLVPAISHACFDFVALIYILRSRPKTSVNP